MRATLPSPYFCTSKPSPPPLDSCASPCHLVMLHAYPQIGPIRMLHFEFYGAYLWWGLELCPELCQLGLELAQMILSGLQNP